jgi:hypothetical protein
MLIVKLNQADGVVILEPDGALSKNDFEAAAKTIDPYIEESGKLKGIIIHVKAFPGWNSFAALISHLKFIKDHHHKVAHVAFVTDSPIGDIAEKLGNHFVAAKVKEFAFNELEQARNWVLGLVSE